METEGHRILEIMVELQGKTMAQEAEVVGVDTFLDFVFLEVVEEMEENRILAVEKHLGVVVEEELEIIQKQIHTRRAETVCLADLEEARG